MILFLVIGMLISILFMCIVLTKQTKKFNKNNRKDFKKLQILFIKDMLVVALIMSIIVVVLPYTIWIFGHKGMVLDEVVKEQKYIYAMDSLQSQYVKKNQVNIQGQEKEYYLVNINKYISQLDAFECSDTEIIKEKHTEPRYNRVALYKNYKLLGKDIISKAVNDMYGNIYFSSEKAEYVKDIIRIYIPN